MSSRLQNLFEMDRKFRVYLRLIIESVAIFIVYSFWHLGIDRSEEFTTIVHFFNAFIWLSAYRALGLHKDRLRFSNLTSYIPIAKISLVLGLVFLVESFIFIGTLNLTSSIFAALSSFNLLVGFRIFARQLIRRQASKTRDNILVFGTSDIAIDLVNAMAFGKKYNVIAFISDVPQNIGSLAGLPVIPFNEVDTYASAFECKLVVLASQTLSDSGHSEILLRLDKLGLSVSYVPTMDRAFDYEVQLKAVNPEEVLGRVNLIELSDIIRDELNKKIILVSGAGGSIGSEICRQILRYQPEKLIILEVNELALYTLEQEISELLLTIETEIQVAYYLGSVTDDVILTNVFQDHKIDIVYHAAAYKHVPIVEENIIAGIQNNVFGTKILANFAHRFSVDKFVLVSSDKAVRPTNVMGATKRLAEIVIQDLAKTSETIFTMVRFGNVLGSSGSVIPKFKSQIDAGGPITVTHEAITRYFMSIPEAAHLVLNAGTFARGGDVFLLDMGDPVKIVNLAKSMVRQHGLQPVLASEAVHRQKRDNEIFIEFSGLRPGEKLYEELLVDGISQGTPNPKIFKSHDGSFEDLDLTAALKVLEQNIKGNRVEAIIEQLCELPLSYRPGADAGPLQASASRLELINTVVSEQQSGKNDYPPLFIDKGHSSLLMRLVSSKLGLAFLHRYFLIKRGMTLGVRVLVQNREGDILLVRHTYVPGWHLPGGGVDIGEDVETAARREVFEETGISALDNLRFLNLELNKTVSDRDHVSYFSAQTNQNPSVKKTAEISDIQFVSRDVANEIIATEHQKYILNNI